MNANDSPLAALLAAVAFAARKHSTQRRKDHAASPFINHPVAVANLLANEVGVRDLATLQAAILHDTIEDTRTTHDELVEHFGREVADMVAEVTDDKLLPKHERKRLQVEHAPRKSPRAAMIKVADKTCNLRDMKEAPPKDWPEERKREYFRWAKQVVDGLPEVAPQLRASFDQAHAAGV